MSAATVEAHFELYALRNGRWVLDACCSDEAEARDEIIRLARSSGVRGARLVREVLLPGVEDPIVTVIVDTTATEAPLEFRLRDKEADDGQRPPRADTPASPPVTPPATSVLGTVRRTPHHDLVDEEPKPVDKRDRTNMVVIAVLSATTGVLAATVVALLLL